MRIITIAFLFLICAKASAINLVINGKTYYISEYQISEDGKEIRINHKIDLDTGSCDSKNKRSYASTARPTTRPKHRNPNLRVSPFERLMNEVNSLGSNTAGRHKRRHQ